MSVATQDLPHPWAMPHEWLWDTVTAPGGRPVVAPGAHTGFEHGEHPLQALPFRWGMLRALSLSDAPNSWCLEVEEVNPEAVHGCAWSPHCVTAGPSTCRLSICPVPFPWQGPGAHAEPQPVA